MFANFCAFAVCFRALKIFAVHYGLLVATGSMLTPKRHLRSSQILVHSCQKFSYVRFIKLQNLHSLKIKQNYPLSVRQG